MEAYRSRKRSGQGPSPQSLTDVANATIFTAFNLQKPVVVANQVRES